MESVTSRDGTPIAFWRSGSGPPLVLVHGSTADHTRWAPILPALDPHFTVASAAISIVVSSGAAVFNPSANRQTGANA